MFIPMKLFKLWRALFPINALLISFALASTSFARADELPKGTIIDKVVCEADSTQSYALYIPSDYTPQKEWPVIYAFDPGARGTLPVRLYQEAAEKYGYIIAGSLNARNGMQNVPLQTAIAALIEDTRNRLSIDEKRIYTTGFSGGARVATRVASSCNGCIAGVIACGAGFPSDITATSATSFVFYGTVGNEDFNYPEMKRLEGKLVSLRIPNHLATFKGEHNWASSQLLVEAVEWIELQAMRTGRRNRDETMIDVVWKKREGDLQTVLSAGNTLLLYSSYAALAADFRYLKNVDEYESRAALLRGTKEFKRAFKKEQDELRQQQEIADRLINLGSRALLAPPLRATAMRELKTSVEGLRKKTQSVSNAGESLVVRRALLQVSAQTFEAALYNYLPNRQYDLAIVNFLVAELVTPEFGWISYDLARAYTLNGETKMAIEALRRAVAKGLTDATVIENQKDFDAIRSEIEFKTIVNGLKRVTPSN